MHPILEDHVMSVLGASGHPSLETDFVVQTRKRFGKIEILIDWSIDYWVAPGKIINLKKVSLGNYFPDTEQGELFLSDFEDSIAMDFLTVFQEYRNNMNELDNLYLPRKESL